MEASFSTDGKLIAFDGYSGAIRNVFVMNSDGSDVHQTNAQRNRRLRSRASTATGVVLYV